MQTNCPKCSNRLVIDDAKVPSTPFMLKCPKCQATIKLPGKEASKAAPKPAASPSAPAPAPAPSPPSRAEAPAAAAPAKPSAPSPSAPAPTPAPAPAPASVQASAPAPEAPPAEDGGKAPAPEEPDSPPPPVAAVPSGPAPPAAPGSAGKALVFLPSSERAASVGGMLERLGFTVETLEPVEDKLLRLQQGDYALVATSRNGVPEDRNLYRLVQTLPPDMRRRLFLLLVGDEFRTGEGTQAFAVLGDVVLNSNEVASSDTVVARALFERRRLFQTFLDAEDRKAEGRL